MPHMTKEASARHVAIIMQSVNWLKRTIAKHCSGISADIHRHDATTNHGQNTMQIRETVEDAFDPWWLSET